MVEKDKSLQTECGREVSRCGLSSCCALRRCGAGLRHVAHALLAGVEPKQASNSALAAAEGAALPGGPVAASAMYLRDRVGVPRDLPYPAARQLRAHLNWLIDSLQPSS